MRYRLILDFDAANVVDAQLAASVVIANMQEWGYPTEVEFTDTEADDTDECEQARP